MLTTLVDAVEQIFEEKMPEKVMTPTVALHARELTFPSRPGLNSHQLTM